MYSTIYVLLSISTALVAYLWHVNRGMNEIPPEVLKVTPKRWTPEFVRQAYQNTIDSPTDIKKYIPPKQNRRYIVVGGSGFVGSWIVNHLLQRGEDPKAIRILDIRPPIPIPVPVGSTETKKVEVEFIKTDVTDQESVSQGFASPWPTSEITSLPLTVFHTVAYINPAERHRDFLGIYMKINVYGTQHVLISAKESGASIFIATSSASIAVRPQQYFTRPWKKFSDTIVQILPNAEPKSLNGSLEKDFATCYSYSKAKAELLVREADDPTTNFRTGCIRPGHGIFGHAYDHPSNLVHDYLTRGGAPTWLQNIVAHYANVQNVSIAHLAFESSLLISKVNMKSDPGGKAYCVTDPNVPIAQGDLYTTLTSLAHKTTPCTFTFIPPVTMLLISYVIEQYLLLRNKYPRIFPNVSKDVGVLTPGLFDICTTHIIYDDSMAKKEIGYNPPLTTLEGLCLSLKYWNDDVEKKLKKGEDVVNGSVEDNSIMQLPLVPKDVVR